jgi:hypothetical protein
LLCKPDGYIRKPNSELVKIARKKRKEKENCKKKDQELEQDKNRMVSGHRASTRGR